MKILTPPGKTAKLASQVAVGLGRLDALNPRMLALLVIILFLTDVGYEGQRNLNVFPWLLLYSPLSILAFLAVFLTLFMLIRRIGSSAARAWSLLIAAMVAAFAKSAVLMLILHGEQFLGFFQERVAGDITIAALYIIVAAVMFHAYNNHSQIIEELNRVSQRLEEQKRTTIEVASDVEVELQRRANAALSSELDRLALASDSVLDVVETASLKMQIQALVRNQVRPLSRELMARVEILNSKIPPDLIREQVSKVWKIRIIPNLDSSFIASYVIAMPNIFFTIASKAGVLNALIVLGVSISYPILGRLVQFALPRQRMSVALGLCLAGLTATVAYVPMGLVIHALASEFALVGLTTFTAGGVLIFSSLCVTAWFALQRTRDENATEILRINQETRHELDLLDQAVWVAQRKWSYIIHGTVQGALTVASSRLEMTLFPDDKLKVAVRADLDRAKAVLVSPPTFNQPLRELFAEIAATWQGVCDFEYQLAPSAELVLAKSQTSTTCLVEITKELISNAKRHAGASKFWLNTYLNSDGDLSILSGNNGTEMAPGATLGLGFEMISQLTRDWHLSTGVQNSFTATLPLPRP